MSDLLPDMFPPSKLGEYKVMEDIAEGTFGIVRKARHTVTGHIVAMKYISKALMYQTRTKTRVQREVEYMRALRHPHIIKLYEVISTPSDIIIVLEYVSGELFKYIVQNGRMPEQKARRFFQQLISGIEYSHKLKIVHRDLKPENVLLDSDLNVKIADFGLSNEIRDGDFLKTSCGSPNYAAPEVIRGGLYTGPEIDVWSCGVILYVMLCGCLPFEDEDVKALFQKISQGTFYMPYYLSPEAQDLINAMLVVDPIRRITIPEVTQHLFFTMNLPRYLTPLPPPPGPVLGQLSALAAPPPKEIDFEIIDGLGRIEPDVVVELANRMTGVSRDDIWEALRRSDGAQGNAVKIAYMLLRDKGREGRDLAEFEEQERDAQLAAMDPRNATSPAPKTPRANGEIINPFEEEFASQFQGDDEEDEESSIDDLDLSPTPESSPSRSSFAVLNTSLHNTNFTPETPAEYAAAKRAEKEREKERRQNRTKWHFGIRSRSPPMEVMLEIYRTLKTLGMEWKEKKNLGGLGRSRASSSGCTGGGQNGVVVERNRELDGEGDIDMKAASRIYFVETRARVKDVVVMMNLQLYMIDPANYLVDFHHKESYRASTEPGAGKFDRAPSLAVSMQKAPSNGSDSSGSISPSTVTAVLNWATAPDSKEETEVVSPFVFMDIACKLILELAGGS